MEQKIKYKLEFIEGGYYISAFDNISSIGMPKFQNISHHLVPVSKTSIIATLHFELIPNQIIVKSLYVSRKYEQYTIAKNLMSVVFKIQERKLPHSKIKLTSDSFDVKFSKQELEEFVEFFEFNIIDDFNTNELLEIPGSSD